MNRRQQQLLNLIIENHIKTAEPVGSRFLVEKSKMNVSAPTVRNEMQELERDGYLTHPHTSAGRVPTEKGYRFYLENTDQADYKLTKKEISQIGNWKLEIGDTEQSQKNLTKSLAELSGEAIVLALSPNKVYYTGLTNLFSKPEFGDLSAVAGVSQIFDHCEECLKTFFDEVGSGPRYFIGSEHPFGNMLSILAFRFGDESLLALLGPTRMNYKKNWALIERAREKLNLLFSH